MVTLTGFNPKMKQVIQFRNSNGDQVATLEEQCVYCHSKRYRGEGTNSAIHQINAKGLECGHAWKLIIKG